MGARAAAFLLRLRSGLPLSKPNLLVERSVSDTSFTSPASVPRFLKRRGRPVNVE